MDYLVCSQNSGEVFLLLFDIFLLFDKVHYAAFYFLLTSETIWDMDSDLFGGLVISKEYFKRVLFLINYSLYLELELIRNQCI